MFRAYGFEASSIFSHLTQDREDVLNETVSPRDPCHVYPGSAGEGYNSGKYLSQRTTLRFLTTYFIQMVVAARVADHFGELGWRIYVLSGLSGFWPLLCDREI